MTDAEWREMRNVAESLGTDYINLIDDPGRQEIEKLQLMVRERFRGAGQVDMKAGEWLVAIRRYFLITEGRDFSDMEHEKALRLAFHLRWLFDRISKLLEVLSLTPAPDSESDPLGAITVRNTFNTKKIRLRGVTREVLSAIRNGGNTEEAIKEGIETLVAFTRDLIKLADAFTTEVAEYEVSVGVGKIDRMQLKDMHATLDKLGKEIDSTENELGLKTDRSEETYASKFNQTLQKVERFARSHPRNYTWYCPICGWEGVLLKKKRAEGELINRMDIWWVWKCPECGAIIAYDVRHPAFDGKMLFWRRAWDLVKRGQLSLKGAAYIHGCAPEHLVLAAQQVYREKLPPHVEKEWDEIEAQSRLTR